MNLKILKRALLLLAATLAPSDSAHPMKYLSRISPFSKPSIDQQMNRFENAQYRLRDARAEAEKQGKTSSRTVGRAVEELNKASQDLRSTVIKAQARGDLSNEHVERLDSFRARIERKDVRRIDEGRSKSLTNEERKTLETLTEVTKPLRASPSTETAPQAVPTGFFPTSKGDASVMLSEKGNDPAYKKPIKSFQDRIEAMKDNEYVQKAQREFDDAKQKSIALEAQFRAAQPSDKNFKELKDEFLKVNKSMMQKQNVLLIELEAAEKSSKPTIEKPVETPRAWTKVIQTDTDKVPSGIKIGQKTADTPPALPSRSSVFKKETSSSFATESEKKLSVSEPRAVITKGQIPLFEQGLKDAQRDLRAAEKDAESTRKAFLTFKAKTENKYPKESELLNNRDFEKARIIEIEKNLSSDTKRTLVDLDNRLSEARKSGNMQEVTALSSRLDSVTKQIDAQKKEIGERQTKLDAYEKQVQNIDPKVMNEFEKINELGAARKAAETKKTDLGLEVQGIQNLLKDAREKTQVSTPQVSEEKPSTSVQRVSTPQEALEKVGARRPQQADDEKNLSSGLAEFLKGKPAPQEEKTGPIPVTKDSPGGRTGVALPPQSAFEKKYSQLPKQEKMRIMQETFTVEK